MYIHIHKFSYIRIVKKNVTFFTQYHEILGKSYKNPPPLAVRPFPSEIFGRIRTQTRTTQSKNAAEILGTTFTRQQHSPRNTAEILGKTNRRTPK